MVEKIKNKTKDNNKNKLSYKNCKHCQYNDTCPKFKCEYISPVPDDKDKSNILLQYLLRCNKPTEEKFLKIGYSHHSTHITNDGVTELYRYYVSIINDSLKIIRSGGTAYLYKISQVTEILKFEQDVSLSVCDGVYYITMNNNK
ncbi:hypothetical protein [Anaerovorax sp. IOR16]|uniref:hypothetical protein n=1 Tax=Anaerovorax sp. IOR16 TaxID=2773458 RepID=UPI0019D26CFD|nr:hypothetical protein [Anaerovorax sp. IOR16]